MMTTLTPTHADLAVWLAEAAAAVSGIVSARHTTPPSRSHLHPVLGPLTAGPKVITALAGRMEDLLSARLPTTPAALFTLASYASALGWLTESLADLTQAVDLLIVEAGLSADATATAPGEAAGLDLSAYAPQDRQAITALAAEAALTPGLYLRTLGQALLACAEFTEACTEIIGALTENAHRLLDESVSFVRLGGEGPDSLPTLVRSLLARMEATP
ncbi:hypothetical protein P3T27_005892 [Kitasatospora sp. MAA19]|uniref:hypothetical protein n=1 Tax=unclassified Kitasatospora TaxID=2633591 RepID=UPI0024749AE4|nr:hypothetical protein [Kitasatospora sp. MAA19]MDH6709146.1 hypothetical protein [Kitasatospora sp. MAA19]